MKAQFNVDGLTSAEPGAQEAVPSGVLGYGDDLDSCGAGVVQYGKGIIISINVAVGVDQRGHHDRGLH